MRRTFVVLWTVLIAVGLTSAPAFAPVTPAESASAADLSAFTAGNIISDAVFYDEDAMTQAEIQSFLSAKGASCKASSSAKCIKDYTAASNTRAKDSYCAAYTGRSSETAAAIIYKVAQACGINPRVLIVTLQKEQGLITTTSPTSGTFRIAMGYGCPDTAACDSTYYGFFNQVYMAARQFQIYTQWPSSFSHAAQKTVAIAWSPNSSCGKGNVYVQNQATANLYNYTPYQPNKAALNAGYGTGDSCSAYGNRNFYAYFTDWFGSTQQAGSKVTSPLIRASGHNEVYLVNGGTLFHVTAKEEYQVLVTTLGTAQVVTPVTLKNYTIDTSKPATLVYRVGTGKDIILIDDGTSHRFPTCTLVAMWGTTCSTAANMPESVVAKFTKGADVGNYIERRGSSDTYSWNGSSADILQNAATATALNGGTAPYIAPMGSTQLDALTKGRTYLQPNSLVTTSASSTTVYYIDGTDKRFTADAATAAEYGASKTAAVVTAAALGNYAQAGTLTAIASSGGKYYAASGGYIREVTAAAASTLKSSALQAMTLAVVPSASALSYANLYVRMRGASEVYQVDSAGGAHWISTMDQLIGANGGTRPTTVILDSVPFAALFTTGTQATVEGFAYRIGTQPEVYLKTATNRMTHVPNWGVGSEYGLSAAKVVSVAADAFTGVTIDKADLSIFFTVDGASHLAHQNQKTKLSVVPAGFTATVLSAAAASRMTVGTANTGTEVFVRGGTTAEVYLVKNGVISHVTTRATVTALNGGTWPTIYSLSVTTVTTFAKGSPLS